MISEDTKFLPLRCVRALGIRNARPVRKQAVSSRRNAPLPKQGLIDRFMANAHGRVIWKIDRQSTGDLLRAPGARPAAMLPPTVPSSVP